MIVTESNRHAFQISTLDTVERRSDSARGVVVSFRDDFGAWGCRVCEVAMSDGFTGIYPVCDLRLVDKHVGQGGPRHEISDETAARFRAAVEAVNGQRSLF